MEFQAWPKIPRLNREVIVTEKIDGTNAQVAIALFDAQDHEPEFGLAAGPTTEDGQIPVIFAGSRKRWITPEDDNFGFAAWVRDNAEELVKLGPGRHFGEWWGKGIQRGYGLDERRFSLFNVSRWTEIPCSDWRCAEVPCCHVVPALCCGDMRSGIIEESLEELDQGGSWAAPYFLDPEGIIVFHTAANQAFKVLLENDEGHKGEDSGGNRA